MAENWLPRVLKSWVEDFVDEDTGEVVSIERNEVIIDRETILEDEHIDLIIESGAKDHIYFIRRQHLVSDYSIIYNTLQKDPCNSEKEAVNAYLPSAAELQNHPMKKLHAMSSINCSSLIRDMTLAKWAVTGSIKN